MAVTHDPSPAFRTEASDQLVAERRGGIVGDRPSGGHPQFILRRLERSEIVEVLVIRAPINGCIELEADLINPGERVNLECAVLEDRDPLLPSAREAQVHE